MREPVPTAVYDTYWRFVTERQSMYDRRLKDPRGPWTGDPILAKHRFTNVFRAADRVSQRLIGDVIQGPNRSRSPQELFYRTMLFKTFNSEPTWDAIERELGPVSWQSTPPSAVVEVLDRLHAAKATIYTAAYIMPSPPHGHDRKHRNHMAALDAMMLEGIPARIERAASLEEVYGILLSRPGIGRFLAFQYAIDLNYSPMLSFDEDEFVIAGPGAIDGISKCFTETEGMAPEDVIRWTSSRMETDLARLGLDFDGLFGRRPRLIDLQNCFCEISKYARVAHPDVAGVAGRTRIKQQYDARTPRPLPQPVFPERWDLKVPTFAKGEPLGQMSLL
jgi:hypothetical protein